MLLSILFGFGIFEWHQAPARIGFFKSRVRQHVGSTYDVIIYEWNTRSKEMSLKNRRNGCKPGWTINMKFSLQGGH
jgi:hypothetical protein